MEVQVVQTNNDRVTVRVGEVFLKVDADPARLDREADAMASAPVPTAEVLWRKPSVLALAALRGRELGNLDRPSTASPAAWAAVGATVRALHDAPLPDRVGPTLEERAERLEAECRWFVDTGVLPADAVARSRRLAETALRPSEPAFVHGDLHVKHVFVDGDEVTGIIDWSEAAQGDPLFDLASLTLGHEARLDDLLDGYGTDVDRDRIRGWWAWRCLVASRWLAENGYGSPEDLAEVAVLRAMA